MRVLRRTIGFVLVLIGCSTIGGSPDAVVLVDTTPGVAAPVDANRPRGPVVVGPDLAPADYTCLGAAAATVGDPMPVVVEVRDWSDQHLRADVTVQAASNDAWSSSLDCTGQPDCTRGVSDVSGHASLTLRAGPVWLTTGSAMPPSDPSQTIAITWITGLTIAHGATTLTVPALSQTIQAALNSGAPVALGRVRDCTGAAVHRAHVRVFDATNREIVVGSRGATAVRYANDGGSVIDDDRTTIDGVFVAEFDQVGPARVEAWGLREVGGPEVLLGCRVITLPLIGHTTLVDIAALESGAPAACGSSSP